MLSSLRFLVEKNLLWIDSNFEVIKLSEAEHGSLVFLGKLHINDYFLAAPPSQITVLNFKIRFFYNFVLSPM